MSTPTPEPAYETYQIPAAIPVVDKKVKLYDVQDHVPNPVYSSNITSREELVDSSEGIWVRIRSPMGVVMETSWFVREKGGEDALELVEEVTVSCNRMLMGIVKSSVAANWQKIHEKIVHRMVDDAKKDSAA